MCYFGCLEVLPSLKEGMIVHVHDIFSPKNYPRSWIEGEVRFWNEQYLVEAFMSHNRAGRLWAHSIFCVAGKLEH